MNNRLRLGLIFGGRSVEHEVSVVSAQHVIAAADPARFEVVPIGVTKQGLWLTPKDTKANLEREDPPFQKRMLRRKGGSWIYVASTRLLVTQETVEPRSEQERRADEIGYLRSLRRLIPNSIDAAAVRSLAESVDVVFPLIH